MDILSYETGIAAAFLIWLYSAAMTMVNINSQLERNLNKVGLRLSWTTSRLKEMLADEVDCPKYKRVFKYVFIYWVSAPLLLLSWFSVAVYAGAIAYQKIKDLRTPAEARARLWRLRNLDLSFDEIVRITEEIKGADPANFENAKNELRESLRLRGFPDTFNL